MRVRSISAAVLMCLAPLAQANEPIDVCVFDLIGASGDQFALAQDFALDMRDEGVEFNLQPYTDEAVAMADFAAGNCDGLIATDIRIRRYNQFTGTLSAVGAIPTYEEMETVLAVLANPRNADRMKSGGYEVAGIFPLGKAYLFVINDEWRTVNDLAGRRIATLDHHPDAIHMVNYVNATVEPSELTDFGGKFNNHSVDAAYAPGWAYDALELYRGVGDEGGVVDYPLGQLTMQLVVRDGVLTDEQAQRSREVAFALFDDAIAMAERYEQDIPEDKWIHIPEDHVRYYQEMFRQNRIELRDGVDASGDDVRQAYDRVMLMLLRRVRCRFVPDAPECTAANRE